MNIPGPFRTVLKGFVLFLATCCTLQSYGQTAIKKAEKLISLMEQFHTEPSVQDSSFWISATSHFFYYTDPAGIYFLKKERESFVSFSRNITLKEYGKKLKEMEELFSNRFQETDSMLLYIEQNLPDSFKVDTLFIPREPGSFYPENIEAKKAMLQKWVFLYLLESLYDKGLLHDSSLVTKEHFLKAVKGLRKGFGIVQKKSEYWSSTLEEIWLKALANQYDPHSDYFSAEEKKEFEDFLSSSVQRFGFSFDEDSAGMLKITGLAPGSPAMKSGKLAPGDIVVLVRYQDGKKLVSGSHSANEMLSSMYEPDHLKMHITVRKPDGKEVTATLTKAFVANDMNRVTGYVLNEDIPIGYIPIPSFFFESRAGETAGCAEMVARELMRLKEENIQGLILDLRQNGGGSAQEAVDLAGIFLDGGPLCFKFGSANRYGVLKDLSRGCLFDGPLVILINGESASASEILCMMLNSNQRALVAGSTSFGKATGQIMLPLNVTEKELVSGAFMNMPPQESGGYLKITDCRFYSLEGYSYQGAGIQPDLKIPDAYESVTPRESDFPGILKNFPVPKKISSGRSESNAMKGGLLETMKDQTLDSLLLTVKIMSDSLKKFKKSGQWIPIYPKGYIEMEKRAFYFDSLALSSHLSADSTSLSTRPSASTGEVIQMDSHLNELLEAQQSWIRKDLILRRAYHLARNWARKNQ